MESGDVSGLPEAVVALIQQRRKIDAIKELREQTGLGLKEAKHAVDAYERTHPDSMPALHSSGGASRFLLLAVGIALVVAILALYR